MDRKFMVEIDELARAALLNDLHSEKIECGRDIPRLFQIMALALENVLLMDTTQWTVVTIKDAVFDDYVLGDILVDTFDRLERHAMDIEGKDYDPGQHEAASQNLRAHIRKVCDTGLPIELLRDIHCKNDFIIYKILEKVPGVIYGRLDLFVQAKYLFLSPRDMVLELMGNIRKEMSNEFGHDFSLLPEVAERYRNATGIVLRSGKKAVELDKCGQAS
ncbi:hypothetical protein PspLS_06526 [Pyricularia sp. CBS 133598]|nr:hypothetical protein PspLS_06526 [Pyricularia sp. CBS 133598]